jgi:sugar phosphate permease
LSDKIKKRALVMLPMLIIASFLCFVIKFFLTNEALPYYPMIFLVGIFIGGPYGLISSVVAIDLA